STHSYATTSQSLELTVPPVPALPTKPAITDPNFAQDALTWQSSEQRWHSKAVNAAQHATAAAQRLRHLPLHRHTYSPITSCLAALPASGPSGPDIPLLAASDLINNEPSVRASFHGSPVLTVQSCPVGTETQCPARATAWVRRLHHGGAGAVTVIRADAATA